MAVEGADRVYSTDEWLEGELLLEDDLQRLGSVRKLLCLSLFTSYFRYDARRRATCTLKTLDALTDQCLYVATVLLCLAVLDPEHHSCAPFHGRTHGMKFRRSTSTSPPHPRPGRTASRFANERRMRVVLCLGRRAWPTRSLRVSFLLPGLSATPASELERHLAYTHNALGILSAFLMVRQRTICEVCTRIVPLRALPDESLKTLVRGVQKVANKIQGVILFVTSNEPFAFSCQEVKDDDEASGSKVHFLTNLVTINDLWFYAALSTCMRAFQPDEDDLKLLRAVKEYMRKDFENTV